jgi:Ca-activated chloride channel family protein
LFRVPQRVTSQSLRAARRFVGGLHATGGTEMLSAFMEAMDGKDLSSGRLQQIVFITDGAVGNERDIFQYIRENLGAHRLFMIGIGSAPNSHFMVEAAHFGRGTFTHIGDAADVQSGISALFGRLKRPVLTDLAFVTAGLSDLVPVVVPDVYAGEPIVLAMKLGEGQKTIGLTGRIGTTLWHQDLTVMKGVDQSGLRINWAREKIRQVMRSEIAGQPADAVRSEVTALALVHHLVSPFTSLVAVDVTPSRPLDTALTTVGLKGERIAGMSGLLIFV